ncbi:MAG: DUF1573 domain-containing protein [Verrucomicrobiales bacterium]
MSIKRGWGIAAALVLGAAPIARAALEFEQTSLERKADLSQERLEVEYPFTNTGSNPVTIVKIDSSCGCLKATTEKNVYAPGESGVLSAAFSVGASSGVFDKSISVTTTSGKEESKQVLELRVHVPALMLVTPKVLSWKAGEAPVPKKYYLEVKREKPVHVIRAFASRDGYECEVVVVEEGKKYYVVLTPPSTEAPLMGVVRIETDCEISKLRRQLVFFSVKR